MEDIIITLIVILVLLSITVLPIVLSIVFGKRVRRMKKAVLILYQKEAISENDAFFILKKPLPPLEKKKQDKEASKLASEAKKVSDEVPETREALKVSDEAPETSEALKVSEEVPETREALKASDEVPETREVLKVSDEAPETREALKVSEEAPETREALKVSDEAPETREALKVSEEAPETREALKVSEETPQACEALKVSEEAPEAREALKVSEDVPETREALKVSEEVPETREALKVSEETPETREARTVSEEAPETREVLKVSDASPENSEALKVSDNASVPVYEDSSSPNSVILAVGVVLICIAGIAFVISNWNEMSNFGKLISILGSSAVFYGAFAIAHFKLFLRHSAAAFYTIGSFALAIALFAAELLELLPTGNYVFARVALPLLAFAGVCHLGKRFLRYPYFRILSLVSLYIALVCVNGWVLEAFTPNYLSLIFVLPTILSIIAFGLAVFHSDSFSSESVKTMGWITAILTFCLLITGFAGDSHRFIETGTFAVSALGLCGLSTALGLKYKKYPWDMLVALSGILFALKLCMLVDIETGLVNSTHLQMYIMGIWMVIQFVLLSLVLKGQTKPWSAWISMLITACMMIYLHDGWNSEAFPVIVFWGAPAIALFCLIPRHTLSVVSSMTTMTEKEKIMAEEETGSLWSSLMPASSGFAIVPMALSGLAFLVVAFTYWISIIYDITTNAGSTYVVSRSYLFALIPVGLIALYAFVPGLARRLRVVLSMLLAVSLMLVYEFESNLAPVRFALIINSAFLTFVFMRSAVQAHKPWSQTVPFLFANVALAFGITQLVKLIWPYTSFENNYFYLDKDSFSIYVCLLVALGEILFVRRYAEKGKMTALTMCAFAWSAIASLVFAKAVYTEAWDSLWRYRYSIDSYWNDYLYFNDDFARVYWIPLLLSASVMLAGGATSYLLSRRHGIRHDYVPALCAFFGMSLVIHQACVALFDTFSHSTCVCLTGVLVSACMAVWAWVVSKPYKGLTGSRLMWILAAFMLLCVDSDPHHFIRTTGGLLISLNLLQYLKDRGHSIHDHVLITVACGIPALALPIRVLVHTSVVPNLIVPEVAALVPAIAAYILAWRPWRFTEQAHRVAYWVAFPLLVILSFANREQMLFHAVFVSCLAVASIVIGIRVQLLRYLVMGLVPIILIFFRSTSKFWFELSWWVYLLVVGLVLVGVFVANEAARKRGSTLAEDLRQKREKLWKW